MDSEVDALAKCAVCYERAFSRLPDGSLLCDRCKPKVLHVNSATNAGYKRSIEALRKTGIEGTLNTARAIDWIYAQANKKKKETPMFGSIKPFTQFLPEVLEERQRQIEKFGEQNHDDLTWLAILMEEVGECAKAILEKSNLREELIQVVAVIFAWIECKERNDN